MKKIILIFSIITLFTSCNSDDSSNLINVKLRIKNNTSLIINSVISNDIPFGTINPNEITNYINFNNIHAYPEITLSYNNEIYNWSSPIDNVEFWATTFEDGKYTIHINALASNNFVDAEIIKDNIVCNEQVIISQEQYLNAPNEEITISDSCLAIRYSASGCDGESWILKLIDAYEIMESNPIQRNFI